MKPSASDPLAAAAQQGDRKAFEALIRQEKAGLYAFVRRYVGDADDAYDVVQDAFVAAWRSMNRYDAARPFGVWLRTIALNKCRDQGRRSKVRRLIMRAFAAEPQTTGRPSEDGATDGALVRLDAAIAQLPARYKEPLLLITTGGLSQGEAARVLKVSPKAIEMRIRRARVLLGAHLRAAEGRGGQKLD